MSQKTIPMRRAVPAHPGGPTTADVHPDQVKEHLFAGWVLVEESPGKVEEITAELQPFFVLPDVEIVAAEAHTDWLAERLASGIESRLSESGEELMKPWPELSDAAKEANRGLVKTVYAAIQRAWETRPAMLEPLPPFEPGIERVANGWAEPIKHPANEADAAQGESLGTNSTTTTSEAGTMPDPGFPGDVATELEAKSVTAGAQADIAATPADEAATAGGSKRTRARKAD